MGDRGIVAKKMFGCHVTGVCSGKNADYVKNELGADEVVDYTSLSGTVADELSVRINKEGEAKRYYDLVIDCVGGAQHGIFDRFVRHPSPYPLPSSTNRYH